MSGRIVLKGPFGFVGSAFVRALKREGRPFEVATRENRHSLPAGDVDLFIDCAGNSRKYLADSDPALDRKQNVEAVEENLHRHQPARYVLLSSSAVYADTGSAAATEEVEAPEGKVSVYGAHKREAEHLVRKAGGKFLILRPAGFFGPGLAKGPVYDMLERLPLHVSPESRMQVLDVDAFAAAALSLADRGGIYNAVPQESLVLSSLQVQHRGTASLPRLDFAMEGRRFAANLPSRASGIEALHRFAGWYERHEARRAVRVLVLAGGRGTRLPGPVPKPARLLHGIPLIRHVVQPFLSSGYEHVSFLLGHGAGQVAAALEKDRGLRTADRVVEDTPLGTGGAILGALEIGGFETAVVMNGDTLFRSLDIERLVKRHMRAGAAATLLAARVKDATRFGTLRVADDGRCLAFEEKAGGAPGFVYTGCMVIDRARFFHRLGPVRTCSLEKDLLPVLIETDSVHVLVEEACTFVDAGTPGGFRDAEHLVKENA